MVIKETINDASNSNTDKLLKCTYKEFTTSFCTAQNLILPNELHNRRSVLFEWKHFV